MYYNVQNVNKEVYQNYSIYRTLDKLLPHKDEISKHLQDRYAEWFGADFDFLFYDVTSTYFEGACSHNPQAKRGYSRDKRADWEPVQRSFWNNSGKFIPWM